MTEKVPFNFGGLSKKYSSFKNARIVVLPVPFDKTSSWGKGADKGPAAIIEASRNMELYDIETDSEVCLRGIFTEKPVTAKTPEKMAEAVFAKTLELIKKGKFVVCLGGEHSVSVGAIKAHAKAFENLSVLHLDAHLDRRDSYEGSKFNHACVMSRAQEIVKNIVSVGIRSMDSSEKGSVQGSTIFFAHKIAESRDWIPEAVGGLSENVYATIDLDVFDPGIMPSTGTPEPGGLGWYSVCELMEALIEKKNLVGFDVVELCPSPSNRAPDFTAAKLVYRLLSMKFHAKKGNQNH
ncbi:MAG: agmatinase [Candidatus Diapherotrites archaeon]|nr:agmatinase [Candidatus Diapherotrites archaeon]